MSELMLSGVIVGIFAMLLVTPAFMAMGISKLEGGITIGERIICCIPIVNLIRAEIKYYGRIGFVTISTLCLIVSCVVRVFVWWNFYSNVGLGTASIIFMMITLVLMLISNMVFVYNVIHDADVVQGAKLFLFAIAFPFGQYYIGSCLTNAVKHMQAKEETFKL